LLLGPLLPLPPPPDAASPPAFDADADSDVGLDFFDLPPNVSLECWAPCTTSGIDSPDSRLSETDPLLAANCFNSDTDVEPVANTFGLPVSDHPMRVILIGRVSSPYVIISYGILISLHLGLQVYRQGRLSHAGISLPDESALENKRDESGSVNDEGFGQPWASTSSSIHPAAVTAFSTTTAISCTEPFACPRSLCTIPSRSVSPGTDNASFRAIWASPRYSCSVKSSLGVLRWYTCTRGVEKFPCTLEIAMLASRRNAAGHTGRVRRAHIVKG